MSKADPANVTKATAALDSAWPPNKGEPAARRFFVIRMPDRVAVHGREQKRRTAKGVLSQLPPATRAGSRKGRISSCVAPPR